MDKVANDFLIKEQKGCKGSVVIDLLDQLGYGVPIVERGVTVTELLDRLGGERKALEDGITVSLLLERMESIGKIWQGVDKTVDSGVE
jgi:hypothetical protein